MKTTIIAAAVALSTTAANAVDVNVFGQTISAGVESEVSYVTGIEEWDWTTTPYASFTTSLGVALSASTDIDMRNLDGDIFQGVDYSAEYAMNGVTLYTEVSSDRDWEFGDFTVGAKVKF